MENSNLEMLEFPRIRELLAGFTSFAVSSELAHNLQPSTNYGLVKLLLQQSAEARHLLSVRPNFSIGGAIDIREPVMLAAKGKVLEPLVLKDIEDSLASLRVVKNSLGKVSNEIPALWDIARQIIEKHSIEENIQRCILGTGDIADSASEKLGSIRRQLKDKRQRLFDKLDHLVKSQDKQKFLQEQLITEREGRYVIPIKADFKKDVKGIVHDVSNTGATLFIEPWETVEMGNDLRQLIVEERLEMQKILSDLSAEIGMCAAEIKKNIELLAEIDLALAKARYSLKFDAAEPMIDSPNNSGIENKQHVLKLVKAIHPLLKGNAIPLTVEMGQDFSILVITGPNAGGKTVVLKTIGLLALMAQAGMPIPASEESHLPLFDGIFADIGDQQSIEQTLSTFSWHINNIIGIIRKSSSKSLVLLDELGISTDPEEGAALARAIMLYLLARKTLTVVTTHYNELKAFAHMTAGIRNASMDFDSTTFTPSYHLTIGIPGRSNALSIASRLGLSKEIIDVATSHLPHGSQEMEILLTDLMTEKQKYESLRENLKKEENTNEQIRKELEKEGQRLKEQERLLIKEAGDKLLKDAAGLHQLIRDVEAELRKTRKKESAERAKAVMGRVQHRLEGEDWQAKLTSKTDSNKIMGLTDIKPGDVVRLVDRNIEGLVVRRDRRTDQIELQIGQAKLLVGIDAVERIAAQSTEISSGQYAVKKRADKTPVSLEFDLRGKRADQVQGPLDRYLNDSFLAGLHQVRIVHGYATGTVRQIVRDLLAAHPLVKSFHPGQKGEGGDGVTIAEL